MASVLLMMLAGCGTDGPESSSSSSSREAYPIRIGVEMEPENLRVYIIESSSDLVFQSGECNGVDGEKFPGTTGSILVELSPDEAILLDCHLVILHGDAIVQETVTVKSTGWIRMESGLIDFSDEWTFQNSCDATGSGNGFTRYSCSADSPLALSVSFAGPIQTADLIEWIIAARDPG